MDVAGFLLDVAVWSFVRPHVASSIVIKQQGEPLDAEVSVSDQATFFFSPPLIPPFVWILLERR